MSTVDVLYAGQRAPQALMELEERGRRVDTEESLVSALARLKREGARLVIVDAAELDGRDAGGLTALRAAADCAVVVSYGPALAHRAGRAAELGADAAFVHPSYPGELSRIAAVTEATRRADEAAWDAGATGLAIASTPSSSPGTSGSRRATASPRVPVPQRMALETLVGDIALLHRSVNDLERLLDLVVACFQRRTGATRISVLLTRRATGELVLQRGIGLPPDATGTAIQLGEGVAGRVAVSGRAALAQDLSELRRLGAEPENDDRNYRSDSSLVLPLHAADGVVGVVCLTDRDDGRPFGADDLRALRFLADQVGQAVENSVRLAQMRDLAVIDELTGLYNRRHFRSSLDREVHRARRYERPLTLAMFDLDNFKTYNDVCGHPAGDRALATVGTLLRTSLREVDIVTRYGGEEFMVILPETSARPGPGARSPFPFVERLRRRVEEAPFDGEEKLPGGKLTLSGGLACFPDDGTSPDELIQKADEQLYVSKARGRNQVTYNDRTVK